MPACTTACFFSVWSEHAHKMQCWSALTCLGGMPCQQLQLSVPP